MNESVNYRPCVVNGTKAIFHGWFGLDDSFIRFNRLIPEDSRKIALKQYEETGFLPNCMEEIFTRNVFGVVEYEDGTVGEVQVNEITFLDTKDLFEEFWDYF